MPYLAVALLLAALPPGPSPLARDLRPAQTRDAWIELGRSAHRLHVQLADGRLRVTDDARRTLLVSRESEFVRAWAAAPFLGKRGRQLLVWCERRDSNREGVVPHDSGWMGYGSAPWIVSHLSFYDVEGGALVERWGSSAAPRTIEALFVDESRRHEERARVVTRERTWDGPELVWYRFGTWSLDVERRLSRSRALALGFDRLVETGSDPREMLDLVAVGDVMLGRTTGERLARHGYEEAFRDVRSLLQGADVTLGNLEGCPGPARGAARGGFDVAARPDHVRALSFLGFDVVSVANNHCEPPVLASTALWLGTSGIGAAGLPEGRAPFGQPVFVTRRGLRVAVLAARALAGDRGSQSALGAAEAEQQLRVLSAAADAVVVLVHWGEEYAPAPQPWQRALAHRWIDAGADAVLGHHPHVVQEVEEYRERFVAYSLGNFLFDQEGYVPRAKGATERGLALRLRFHRRLGWAADPVPLNIVDRFRVVPGE